MGAQTVFTKGVQIRKGKGENGKGSDNMVTEGSIIHVYPDQFMLLVDGGKVVDYTAEPGYYKVSLDTQPSLMNGTLGKAVKESLGRIRFGGIAPTAQRVYYINLQEIRGLKFGTKMPSTILTVFIMQSCFYGPMERIPLRSQIR